MDVQQRLETHDLAGYLATKWQRRADKLEDLQLPQTIGTLRDSEEIYVPDNAETVIRRSLGGEHMLTSPGSGGDGTQVKPSQFSNTFMTRKVFGGIDFPIW
jgi:hypothetical protein